MRKSIIKQLFVLLFLFAIYQVNAQVSNKNTWDKKLKPLIIKPVIGLLLWSTYTFGMKVYNETSGIYEQVDNRLNTHLRRSRLGIKGQAYKNLKFNITGAFDLVGRDILAGTQGGGNNGASPSFRIWNAYVQWNVIDNRDGLNITAGYITPQIGRESITAALRVSSLEKSWSQNYLRRQLVGTGPGRATGINLGGLFLNKNNISLSYDLGIFNPVYHSLGGNSVGSKFSPLFTGRAVLYLGDPESEEYTISHKVNYFGKRNGLSIALSAASQGETEIFNRQYAIGTDWLLNWKNINLDGEWTLLIKKGEDFSMENKRTVKVNSNTGYLRMSYNIVLKNLKILEPVFMVMQFNGPLKSAEQIDALSLGAFSGKDYSYDLGLNYYLNPDLKLSLHYTWRSADAGDAGLGTTINNYFSQGGVGAIHRGDWLGIGLVVII